MQIIIHIGVHKTATTWLQQKLFSSHPEINLINNFYISRGVNNAHQEF